MKHLLIVCLICALGLSACSTGITASPIATNPPAAATPAFTALPPSAVPTEAAPTVAFPTTTATNTPAPLPTATLILPTATLILPTATLIPPSATLAGPALSLEQLRGATLTIQGADQKEHVITLKDGKFQQGSDPAQPGYISVKMGEQVAFGDLNGDGSEDAAISIAENYGGSGTFVSVVAVLNQGGNPQALATALIDDRPMLNRLEIKDGQLWVDATVHGPNDPMCCPSLPSKRAYRLVDNSLALAQLSTTTANSIERVIQIDSPANGTEISGPFVIKGGVTVSPFENSLGYSVFVPGAKDPVLQAGFTIKGDGLGGPGTFELPIDPAKINFKGPLRIEISDVSAADGSYLAVETVFVVLK